jgi:hypothetical protein
VAWVLQQAWLLSGRFLSLLPEATGYRLAVEDGAKRLEQVRKIEAIRTAMAETNVAHRPGKGSLQEAARSRRGMYIQAPPMSMTRLPVSFRTRLKPSANGLNQSQ